MATSGGFFNMARLTIILPCYNFLPGYIRNIKNIAGQKKTHKDDFEIVVSDDSEGDEIFDHYMSHGSLSKNIRYYSKNT